MQQSNLDAVHNLMADKVQLWASGLITDRELANALAILAEGFTAHAANIVGLIDPATGLRYQANA